MDTSVEHAASSRPPRRRLSRAGSSRRGSSRRLTPSSPAQQAAEAQPPAPSSAARGAAREALVAALAAAAAACARAGWPGLAAATARLLFSLGMAPILTDVAVQLAIKGQAAAAGALCVAAAEQGPAPLVHRLCVGLLTGGHTAAAAATAEACWRVAAAAGWQPMQTAALLAPAVVSAVDGGHAPAVAQTLQLLFNARQQPLLMWLLEAMAAGLERPDAAAAVAWEAMQHAGGAGKWSGEGVLAASDLAALLTVDRHHQTSAALALHLYNRPGAAEQVAAVLAAGNAQAIEAGRVAGEGMHGFSTANSSAGPARRMILALVCLFSQLAIHVTSPPFSGNCFAGFGCTATWLASKMRHAICCLLPGMCCRAACHNACPDSSSVPADVAAVCWLLFEQGQLQLLADATAALTDRSPGGQECTAELCWHAMTSGREQMVVAVSRQLLLSGRAAEAAAALQVLYAAGQPQQVARIAATAVASAVDAGGGGVAAVAACNVLLWRQGAVPLQRDVQLALARQGRADAAAAASWHALQRGEAEMVAGVSTAVVRTGAAREAAELAAALAEASGSGPAVTAALSRTMAAAARAGSAAEAAAVAAQLQALGAAGLLKSVTAQMLLEGRAAELASIASAAAQQQPAIASPNDLAAILAAPSPAPAPEAVATSDGTEMALKAA
ncbi:hypothetical protein ABPG75_002524 [Micractinium tetrahymenae]